jgi:penicillin-binding protein 1B
LIVSNNGDLSDVGRPERIAVLDPRVDYLMLSLMQEVMRSGTAAGVRSRGFTLPAAGKTGTSRDGWFAGFTSKLVCVVWVGFDDGKDLNLEGAKTALPIWTEFMKRAHQHREYRNVRDWDAPDGIVSVDIDPATGQLATAGCPIARSEVFIAGTQPVELCRLHGGGGTQVAGWETAPAEAPKIAATPPGAGNNGESGSNSSLRTASVEPLAPQVPLHAPPPPKKEEKKGFFGRIRDIFR